MSTTVIVDADTTAFDQKTRSAEARAKQAARAQISAIRRTTEIGLLTLQAFGVVVDQTLRAQVRIAQVAIETIIQVNAAAAAGTLGLSTVATVGVAALQIFILIRLINAIEQARTEEAAQLQATITLLYMTEAYIR